MLIGALQTARSERCTSITLETRLRGLETQKERAVRMTTKLEKRIYLLAIELNEKIFDSPIDELLNRLDHFNNKFT